MSSNPYIPGTWIHNAWDSVHDSGHEDDESHNDESAPPTRR